MTNRGEKLLFIAGQGQLVSIRRARQELYGSCIGRTLPCRPSVELATIEIWESPEKNAAIASEPRIMARSSSIATYQTESTRCFPTWVLVVGIASGSIWADSSLCQQPSLTSMVQTKSVDRRFETPEKTLAQWTRSVNREVWQREYECYSVSQQARFTYFLMVSTDELKDAPDLSEKLATLLKTYSFPDRILDSYPSQRLDLSELIAPEEIQSAIEKQSTRTQSQIESWEHEVHSLPIDWVSVIGSLQPLFRESYNRHKQDLHPSHTGISQHLGFYKVNRSSILRTDSHSADGSIVFTPRDSNVYDDEDVSETSAPTKGLKGLFARIKNPKSWTTVRPKDRTLEIQLEQLEGEWKIVAAPHR